MSAEGQALFHFSCLYLGGKFTVLHTWPPQHIKRSQRRSPEGSVAYGRQTRRPLLYSFISQTIARKTADLKAHAHLQTQKPCTSLHFKYIMTLYRSTRFEDVCVSVQKTQMCFCDPVELLHANVKMLYYAK